ncbi:MAG: PxKF domain-containing protein [Proteobacteria bacterium]|nr:PxKF domain-containing protein [Pseudomonadota bacterium]
MGDRVAYEEGPGDWPNMLYDVWTVNPDGSDPVNITGPGAGNVGGINCDPKWSPDGSLIAFRHCDPVEGLLPCEAGFHAWVINSDGTDAHRVLPPECPATSIARDWSPNGYRLLVQLTGGCTVTIDSDGTDMTPVPNVGGQPVWSPDGSQIAGSYRRTDTVGGQPGVRRGLGVVDSDGANLQILVEQFIAEADAFQHITDFACDLGSFDWVEDVVHWVGPVNPQWSPSGDCIAFLAAMPFDPNGACYKEQIEVWVYHMATADLTRITDNTWAENSLSWNGNNTLPSDPEVTVDNTTVTFSEVTGEGLTTILRDDDPPALPADYQFCGEYYNIDTTADYTSPITICMAYEDADVPGGNEDALCLLHYNETTENYEDITTFKDTEANLICGEVDSLSIFGLATLPIFGGFRPPINADGTSEWKAGRTIPVKFMITDALGNPITNAICHLSVWGPLLEAAGDGVLETAEAESADVGDTFRYDEQDGQYIYNLSTKGWGAGTYLLEVTAEGWPGFAPSVRIGLR